MRKITIVLTLFAAALALPLQAGVTLEGSTDALELVTSSTSAIDYACSWSNVTATALTTPGTTKGNIAAATTTTVIAAPAASNFRHVRKCWFHNDAGGSSNTLTVQIDVSATNRLLYAATLLAGEALSLTEDGDFILYDSTGQKKSLLVTGGGTEATALRVTVANDSTGVLSVDDNGSALTVDAVNLDIRDLTATDVVTVTDGAGALNVIVDSATLGTVTVSDGAGAMNVIVDSSALPSGAATSALQDGIIRDGAGDTTQANVTTGRLSVDGSGVTQPVSGTVTAAQATASSLNAEVQGDAAHDATLSGNPVLMGGASSAAAPADVSADGEAVRAWHLRNGATATVVTAAGALIGGDAANGLDVDVTRSALPSGASTSALQDGIIKDGTGDTTQANVASGKLSVDPGTVTVTATNLDVQIGGSDTVTVAGNKTTNNAAPGATNLGVLPAVAEAAAPSFTEGNQVGLSTNLAGALRVTGGGGGTEYVTNAVAPADPTGTTVVSERDDQLATLTEIEGDWTNTRATSKGALWVAIPDTNGDPITSFGGGTEYNQGTVTTDTDTLKMAGAVRRDTAAVATGVIDGDRLALSTDSVGRLRTTGADTTQPVSGTVTVTDGAGALNVIVDSGTTVVTQPTATNLNAAVVGTGTAGAPAGNILTVQGVASMTKLLVTPDSVALPANQSVNVAQVAGTNTVTGGVAGIIAVGGNVANAVAATANPVPVGGIFTTAPATLTTGQTATMQFTAAQNLKHDVTTIAGTAPTTAGKLDVKAADGDVFVRQATATNLNAAVVGTGTAGAPAGNILTIQGVASMTKLLVTPDSVALPANQSVNVAQVAGTNTVTGGVAGIIAVGGNVANAVAATANPVPVGGIFTTVPATLTTGQTGTMQFTAAQNIKTDIATIAGTAPTTAGMVDVKINQTTTANDVDVVSQIPGTGATNLGKAEDSGHGSTDTGVMALAVQQQADGTPTEFSATDLDYSPISVDSFGTMSGSLYMPWAWTYHENSSSALTDTTVHASCGAGLFNYIDTMTVSTGSATALNVFIEDSTTTTILGPYYLEAVAGRGFSVNYLPGKKQTTAATLISITTSAAIAHGIDIQGHCGR